MRIERSWRRPAAAAGAGLLVTLSLGTAPRPASAQLRLPAGFSAAYETQYSNGTSELSGAEEVSQQIFENWLDVSYTRGDFYGGLRYVAFNPPDPSIFPGGDKSDGIDFGYVEYSGSRFTARGGNFYALFGRGLALRMYEDRTLRVDTNALGATGTFYLPDGTATLLAGQTVDGNAEDADRGRSEPVYAVDVEHGLVDAINLRAGGSWATTDVGDSGDDLEPLRLKAARASANLFGVDVVGEFARVDGPSAAGARRVGFEGPNFHGRGVYASAATTLGDVGVIFDYKDYDALIFRNNAGIDHIVPPATLRDHTFSLLNRHPHQLDTADERGFQLEVNWVTEWFQRFTPRLGLTSVLANWSRTRNQDADAVGNHFEDRYLEIQQEVGEGLALIGGLSFQRSLASTVTPDPYRRLWTPVFDVRYRLTDVHALHVQFEHQHDSSEVFGEFDVEFLVLEWTRSPDLTLGMLYEHTNKSDRQLDLLGESERDFVAASLDYNLFGNNDLRLYYGTRNAGFICVGGVCRFEPAFDGFEASLISRF